MEISFDKFCLLKDAPTFKGKIASSSMEPVIRIGDIVSVEVGTKDLKRFDIIVFWREGKLTCHFLWNINKRVSPYLLLTKSLRLETDPPIKPEEYLGKVISHNLSGFMKFKIYVRHLFIKD